MRPGERVVQLNRRTRVTFDEAGVVRSLAFRRVDPRLPGAGGRFGGWLSGPARVGREVYSRRPCKFGHIECIPADPREWKVDVGNATALAATFSRERDLAFLFRTLATLRTDIDLFDDVDQLQWKGPTSEFKAIGERIDAAIVETKRPTARPRGAKARSSPNTPVIAEE